MPESIVPRAKRDDTDESCRHSRAYLDLLFSFLTASAFEDSARRIVLSFASKGASSIAWMLFFSIVLPPCWDSHLYLGCVPVFEWLESTRCPLFLPKGANRTLWNLLTQLEGFDFSNRSSRSTHRCSSEIFEKPIRLTSLSGLFPHLQICLQMQAPSFRSLG